MQALLLGVMAGMQALHLGVMAWILGVAESTISYIFEAWMSFGHAVLSKMDLTHPKYLCYQEYDANSSQEFGISHILLVIDATEFKISSQQNFHARILPQLQTNNTVIHCDTLLTL